MRLRWNRSMALVPLIDPNTQTVFPTGTDITIVPFYYPMKTRSMIL